MENSCFAVTDRIIETLIIESVLPGRGKIPGHQKPTFIFFPLANARVKPGHFPTFFFFYNSVGDCNWSQKDFFIFQPFIFPQVSCYFQGGKIDDWWLGLAKILALGAAKSQIYPVNARRISIMQFIYRVRSKQSYRRPQYFLGSCYEICPKPKQCFQILKCFQL